jgi:DNA-binding response OmpR family regulator
VDVSQNAQEALELLDRERDYELVLTDFNLPGLNGLELICQIRKRYLHCKTLLMTGTLSGNDINTENCLLKPFGFAELILRIKECLSSP